MLQNRDNANGFSIARSFRHGDSPLRNPSQFGRLRVIASPRQDWRALCHFETYGSHWNQPHL